MGSHVSPCTVCKRQKAWVLVNPCAMSALSLYIEELTSRTASASCTQLSKDIVRSPVQALGKERICHAIFVKVSQAVGQHQMGCAGTV